MMDRISSFTLILILLFFALPTVAHPTSAIEIEEVNGLEIPSKILANFENDSARICFGTHEMTAENTSEISYSKPYSKKITYTKSPCEEGWQSFGFEFPSLLDLSNYSAISIRVYGSCSISAWLSTSITDQAYEYLGLRSSTEPDKWTQLIWDLTATDIDLLNVTGITFVMDDEINTTRTFFLDDIELTTMDVPKSGILSNFEDNYVYFWNDEEPRTIFRKTSEISYNEPYSMNITYTKLPCEEGWQSFGFEFPRSLNLSDYSAICIRVYGACSISAWLSTSITDQAYEYLGLRSSTEPDKWTQLIWDLTATDVDLLNVTGITFVMDDEINTTRTFFLDDIELTTAAIYVPEVYPTIQDAVNAASDGDTIIVRDGTYIENVKVYKRLTIQSENGCDNCIVQAANSNYHVFGVSENYVNIRGFTVEGANRTVGSAGIYLGGVSHCHISNNKASKNDFGIYLDDSSSNMLTNNIANNNNFHGIYLYNSSNNSLSTNNAYNNDDTGICLDSSKKNILTKNTVYNNRWNGICLDDSGNNTLMNNIASNTHNGICLDNSSNTTLTNNTLSNNTYSGIWLNNSSNNLLMNNNAKNNLDGIALISSSNSSLMNNTLYNNTCSGFYLGDSSNNSLVNNNVYNNTHNGFYLTNSCSNSLMNNVAKNNSDGITLDNSSNTTLTNNTLSCNTYSGIWLKDTSSSNLLMNNNAKNNLDGVVLISSSNNSLMNNTVYNNTCSGFYLGDSSNNSLVNNNVYNNTHNGFYLTNSSSNSLTKNTVYNNIYNGFYLTNSSNNLLMNNNVKNNLNGIVLIYSNNNLIYHNNYIDNDNQSYDEAGTNLWNSSYPTGGNYWNDYNDNDAYSGPDQNLPGSDGIGNTPYNISGDASAQDRYPFLNESGWLTGLTTITISPSTKTLYVGEKQWFTATAKDQNGDPVSGVVITWESSDTAVGIVCETSATTDADGKATTNFMTSATGTITVKATSGTVSGTVSVTVQRKVVAGGGGGGGGSTVTKLTVTPTPTATPPATPPATPATPTPTPTTIPTATPPPGNPLEIIYEIITHPLFIVGVVTIIIVVVIWYLGPVLIIVVQKFIRRIKEHLKISVWLKPLLYLVWICVVISTFLSLIILLLNFDQEWVWKSLLIISIPLSFIAGASNKLSDPPSILGMMPFITILSIIGISGLEDLHITRLVITLLVICWCIIIYKYSPWLLSIIRKRYLFSIDIDAELEGELNDEIISERLKNEFTKKEITLEEPNLRKEKNNRWKITDGEEIYILKRDKKEDKKLNIYR